MTSSGKKGKAAVLEFDNQTKDMRQVLTDQLKCFDSKTDGKLLFLADLQEFYRRLSEIELDYSRNLERLSKMYWDKLQRHKSQRKERGPTMDLWQEVLIETKNKSKMHLGLSDNVSNNIVNRFMIVSDDCQRIAKKCREIGTTLQEELLKSVQELHRRLHRYHTMASESKSADQKLQKMEDSRRKNEKTAKQLEKHQQKCKESRKRCVKAKNDYVLSLASTNQFLESYYGAFLSKLLDGFDFNYHESFKRGVEAYVTAEASVACATVQSADAVREVKLSVEAEKDKKFFFEDNQAAAVLPFLFSFLPYADDELNQVSPQQTDVIDHHYKVFERLQKIKAETEEIEKTAAATSDALLEMYRQWDNEMIKMAGGDTEMAATTASCASIKNSSEDLEMYYIAKLRELILTSSLKVRMEAENDMLTKTLGEVTPDIVGAMLKRPHLDISSKEASAILESVHKKAKVFGCNLEEYLKITGREIPEVVESCVKFIKKFGLNHQGIFRLSGSSTEINDMKQLFENGRDPLAGPNHWKDINAVAGIMRVYFRELEDSLYPSSCYQAFIKASLANTVEDGTKEISAALSLVPDSVVKVMKYLFSFLRLVSENSDENKMDAHNLAVVFGPTLLRIPTEQDMIAFQSQVNGMVEHMIKYCDEIFPGGDGALASNLSETEESDSEEDFEARDAEALFSYSARSSKELSFNKGDIIRVFRRFNADWWDGTINGTDGFVPATYIRIHTDDNDAEMTDGEGNLSTGPEQSSPSPKSSDRPKDFNLPPRIPKREGSLKGRDDVTSPVTELASPTGSVAHSLPSSGTSTFKKAMAPAISSDEIVKRQLTLLRKSKDDLEPGDGKPIEKDQQFAIPRLRSISPCRKSHSSSQEKPEEGDKQPPLPEDKDTGSVAKEENQKPSEVVWQPRETSLPGNHIPPESPRPASGPKIPPAVLPKPKGSRGPAAPFRKNSDDLLATLQAAQAVRSNRGSASGDEPRKSRGSVGDDTSF